MREGNDTINVLTLGQDPTTPLMAATKRYVDNNVANAMSLSLAGTPAGQIIFSKGSTVGGNANLFFDNTNVRLGIGTSAPAYALDFAGTGVTGRFGTAGDNVLTTSGTSLTFSQTGDVDGYSALTIMNRTGLNGAEFSTLNSPNPLVDFIFTTGTTAAPITRNFRFETRSTYQTLLVPEFHIGGAVADAPTLTVADTGVLVTGNATVGGGAIWAPVGSAAAPTHSFTTDPNTGMYDLGADGLGFSLGGVSTFTLNSAATGSAAIVNATTALTIPVGNTAQRPTTPTVGMIRYNTDITSNEIWDQQWTTLHAYLHPGWRTSTFYGSVGADTGVTSTTTYATGTIYVFPFERSTNMSFDRVGCEVTTASVTTDATARMAVYDMALSSAGVPLGLPGTLLSDLGTVSITSVAQKEITVTSASFLPAARWFWIAVQFSAGVTMRSITPTSGGWWVGRSATAGAGPITGITATATYGAFATTFPTTVTLSAAAMPFVWVRSV